jgi:hypothetical protein
MIEFVRSGPGRSEVERVEVSEESPAGTEGFEIR